MMNSNDDHALQLLKQQQKQDFRQQGFRRQIPPTSVKRPREDQR